jgi:tRNA-splicing ligase RtcB
MKVASGSTKAKEGHYPLDVESEEGKSYINDMGWALNYALENRRLMMLNVRLAIEDVLQRKVGNAAVLINRNHNHAELRDGLWIHRKGATHAEAGMLGVIPGNMRDGSFIVRGKGNPDSLYSSSHGAGRVLGRKAAKAQLDVEAFREQMKGIVGMVGASTLDEAPGAYKDIYQVMSEQSDLVDIVVHVKPILNVKG